MDPQWLQWAKALQTMTQTGLTYTQDPYDIARYKAIRDIAYEIMATHAHVEVEHIHQIFQEEHGHATPKVDVRAAIFKDDTILLVKERSDGGWTLPGGWADVGESASEAVAREVFEESGYHVNVTRLLAVYDRNKQGHLPSPYYIYKIYFEAAIVGGTPTPSSETSDIAFFPEDGIPPLSLSRTLPTQIERFFAMHRQSGVATDFD
jgi:ADP-ribose pyrophosphatase YjhB (NUDIX family)